MKNIKLAKPHQHNGIAYLVGDEIKVNEADAAWLVENSIGVEAVHKQDVLPAAGDVSKKKLLK